MKVTGETVLLYNLQKTDKGRMIKMVLIRMGIKIKNIDKSQYLEKLGALAGLDGYTLTDEIYNEPGFDDEMLVMKGFTSKRIDEMLFHFRKNKIEKVQLKAVLTATNEAWNSLELYKEIKEENEQMSKGLTSTHEQSDTIS